MTNEDAKRVLLDSFTGAGHVLRNALDVAIDALDRQEPQVPKGERFSARDSKMCLDGTLCYCRRCGEEVDEDYKYCPKCGQAIDWNWDAIEWEEKEDED